MTRTKTAYERGVEAGYTRGYADGHDEGWFAARRAAAEKIPTITDEMVEAAARQIWGGVSLFRAPDSLPSADSTDASMAGMGKRYRRAARAALEAAFNPKETDQ